MKYTTYDLVVLSRTGLTWAEGPDTRADEVIYFCKGIEVSEQEYATLFNVLMRYENEKRKRTVIAQRTI